MSRERRYISDRVALVRAEATLLRFDTPIEQSDALRDDLRSAEAQVAYEQERNANNVAMADDRIHALEETISAMRSRIETADSPFGKGMEIRVIVSALDLAEARDPHILIDSIIDVARQSLHRHLRVMIHE